MQFKHLPIFALFFTNTMAHIASMFGDNLQHMLLHNHNMNGPPDVANSDSRSPWLDAIANPNSAGRWVLDMSTAICAVLVVQNVLNWHAARYYSPKSGIYDV